MSNRTAFLDVISKSEGTFGKGDNGYNVLVGGGLFTGYADHPRRHVQVRPGLWSTAAGRYQILERTFDFYKDLLKLEDFSPASQDAIALQMIKETSAMGAVDRGDILTAIERCAHLWASFPGSNYSQPQQKISTLLADYSMSGGTFTNMVT